MTGNPWNVEIVTDELADDVAEILIDTDREPWFAAMELGYWLDTPQLRELERLLFEDETQRLCTCVTCEENWADPIDGQCLWCSPDDE